MYDESKVRECFEANPEMEVLTQTIDGQCFANEDDARFHSKQVGGGLMVVERAALPVIDTASEEPQPKKKKN
jgi:hypothetical protein